MATVPTEDSQETRFHDVEQTDERATMLIPLFNSRRWVTIDDVDAPLVMFIRWTLIKSKSADTFYAQGYIRVNDVLTRVLMHRYILGITDSKIEVDHKNGDGLDNTRNNIRACTRSQNAKNRRLNKDNTTGYKGVLLCKSGHPIGKPYKSQLRFEGKTYGTYFSTAEEASANYLTLAERFHGEFANGSI